MGLRLVRIAAVLAVTGRGVDSRLLLDEVWMITSRPLHQLVRATEVGRSSSYERWAYQPAHCPSRGRISVAGGCRDSRAPTSVAMPPAASRITRQ